MADRLDYFFRMRVQESELDLGFELLEQADRDLAADLGIFGIISGAVPTQHSPVPDLTIDLTSPTRAYDHLGQRIFFGTDQTVDCSTDLVGIPTEVTTPGRERRLGVFLRFERQLSDPRTDGNSQRVFFRRDESFELVVRQAPEAAAGSASRVALQEDELLVCDVRLEHGQTQILDEHIDLSRRQAFIFATGNAVEIESGLWSVLEPAIGTAQAALDEVDAELAAHFGGSARRHRASDITLEPPAWLSSTDVQAAFMDLLTALASATLASPGARRIGSAAVTGVPHGLTGGTVGHQLAQLLAWLNAHLTTTSEAHPADAIVTRPHAYLRRDTVQGQLEELVVALASRSSGLGASQLGNILVPGLPYRLLAGSVLAQLTELLGHLNGHVAGGDHDGRYYNVGELVDDSHRLDGEHASAFARTGHDHDDRYLRQVLHAFDLFDPGETKTVGTLDEQPSLVSLAYSYIDSVTGRPQATVYVRGMLTQDIRLWVTKTVSGGGEKEYAVTVRNGSSQQLLIVVTAHTIG